MKEFFKPNKIKIIIFLSLFIFSLFFRAFSFSNDLILITAIERLISQHYFLYDLIIGETADVITWAEIIGSLIFFIIGWLYWYFFAAFIYWLLRGRAKKINYN